MPDSDDLQANDANALRVLLGVEESEHVEFKGGSLGVKELIEYAVGVGNSGGGVLVLGVSDKRREVRGLSEEAVASLRSAPTSVLNSVRIRVEVESRTLDGKTLVVVTIPGRPRGRVFHTADGKYLMRSGENLVGMPEAEVTRILREEGGHFDWLAAVVPGAWQDLVSLVELDRLRAILRAHRRDELASLDTLELLSALEVLRDDGRGVAITRVGVLLVGTREAVRQFVPTHEVKLQRFGAAPLAPILHEDLRVPLLHVVERAEALVASANKVESFQAGLFRVDLPQFPEPAWREALANALAHRDYEVPGNIAIRVYEDRLEVGSPGGWFGGVTASNVLVTESRRRNELLAAVLQRVGLAERSAVGVKRMFRTMLLAGKNPPVFRSTPGSVTVVLDATTVDQAFGALAAGAWGEDRSFSAQDLLALSLLRRKRRIRTAEAADVMQLDGERADDVLDKLAVRKLVTRGGVGRGRYWTLGPEAYRRLGIEHERPADVGIEERTFEGLLLDELRRAGTKGLAPADMRRWSHYGKAQTTRILQRLSGAGQIAFSGKRGLGARYWLPEHAPAQSGEGSK